YDLQMVSQVWRGITWRHTIRIVHPPKVRYGHTAVLYITGDGPNDEELKLFTPVTFLIQAPIAILYNVPNQPLFGGLREDDLIAHTFVKFLETGDETWPLLLPMTKSAVKAMDAIQEFAKKEWDAKVEGFMVTGASKRGWTTWLTAVVDRRVIGIAPLVYDNLNIPAQMPHQLEMWGRYSEQISEYVKRGLLDKMETERGKRLVNIVDPYFYLDRLALPKLIVTGTNDRYWTIDALNFYWDALPGEKWVLYVPNSGHGLEDTSRVMSTLVAFFHYIAGGIRFPKLDWRHISSGRRAILSLTANPMPVGARLWVATSKTLDFRESKWRAIPMRRRGKEFVGEIEPPKGKNLALFGEADFRIGTLRFSLSTTVRIVRSSEGVSFTSA
ncbi:MAG TPA: phenylacetic acid degradation protein, partial [Armatimonadetes bacterium]|nr:phenylacetic acid degradation protein [Armatimonadota bacterium]